MPAPQGAHGFFPSGGWAKGWTADPNRGFGKEQPGSWQYNILPFVEEQVPHELGRGLEVNSREFRAASLKLHKTSLPLFHCPTRRAAKPYPGAWGRAYNSTASSLPAMAKSDYAANGGDGVISSGDSPSMSVPSSYPEADDPDFRWPDTENPDTIQYHSGIMYYRSEIKQKPFFVGRRPTLR